MQEFIQFVVNHWLLTSLFGILLILLFIEEARSKGLLGQINPQEVVHLMNRESATVIDIRSRENFQGGHIIGAINLPEVELEKDLNKLIKYKDHPIIIVCNQGQKSGQIATKLKKQNYQRIHVLSGGMNAWKNAHMPLAKT